MSRNDALELTRRLYSRVPANYRAYDAESPQGFALLSLLRVIGEQAANLHQDIEELWDDFFIETAADWVVPYIGGLVGTRLLPDRVEQSDRLEVANTVRWRRSRGTPAMLRSLGRAVTGWPVDLAEYFDHLAWSQNVNHPRLLDPLSPDLGDVTGLSRLGRADDPASHAADPRQSAPLDLPRLDRATLGVGRASWGTPGRYGIKELGFLFRRLLTFRLRRVTPAAADPRLPATPGGRCYTFDPLHHEGPLFVEETREPLTRAAFEQTPWRYFGVDVGVRQFGILLASDAEPAPSGLRSQRPFRFGGRGPGLQLAAGGGLEILDLHPFETGEPHFLIEAHWIQDAGGTVRLGVLSTLLAAAGSSNAFQAGGSTAGPGRLALRVVTGRPLVPAPPPTSPPQPTLGTSPGGRFPGAVVAVRAAPDGRPRTGDALYVHLPAITLRAADAPPEVPFDGRQRGVFHVDTDGAAYTAEQLTLETLARSSDGQVYPPRLPAASTVPAREFARLARRPGRLAPTDPVDLRRAGAIVLDDARLSATPAIYRVELYTGAFQVLGAVATVEQDKADHPELEFGMPGPRWPSFSYAPRRFAEGGEPDTGLLAIHVTGLAGGDAVPEAELVITNRAGDSLLVYLPEVTALDADGVRWFVADDGSTRLAPADDALLAAVQRTQTFAGLPLARASLGQVLPILGRRPIEHRRPVAVRLCADGCVPRVRAGELGVDPERGVFAFAAGDPAAGGGLLSVDYVEAFSDRIGARTYGRDRRGSPPTRIVAQLGDAVGVARDRVHTSIADALARLGEGGATEEVVEIADSGTYALDAGLVVDRIAGGRLTLQAADGARPCIVLRAAPPTSPPTSPPTAVPGGPVLRVAVPLERLELSGLLVSGGATEIVRPVDGVLISACTLDPRGNGAETLIVTDDDRNSSSTYLLCRTVSGAIRVGDGVERLTVADSIVDRWGGLAISGLEATYPPGSPPGFRPAWLPESPPSSPPTSPPASPPSAGRPFERPDVLTGIPALAPRGRREIAALARHPGLRADSVEVLAETPVRNLHLERVTILGRIRCETLEASECLLDDVVTVEDQQSGCIRFSRYELGSTLPRRFRCVPSDEQYAEWTRRGRCEAPLFGSRTFGWPNYLQLAARTPDSIRTASERRSEVGAYTGRLDTLRVRGFEIKAREFMPVGMTALALAET